MAVKKASSMLKPPQNPSGTRHVKNIMYLFRGGERQEPDDIGFFMMKNICRVNLLPQEKFHALLFCLHCFTTPGCSVWRAGRNLLSLCLSPMALLARMGRRLGHHHQKGHTISYKKKQHHPPALSRAERLPLIFLVPGRRAACPPVPQLVSSPGSPLSPLLS